MTKRLLYYSLFLIHYSLLSASAETYILPARADLGFAMPTVSIPLGEYTNCVAYYTAAAPVFDEGTADYLIPDLSPAHNDATQPGTGYQPTRVYTDGEWAFNFDGVDDYLDTEVMFNSYASVVTRMSVDSVGRLVILSNYASDAARTSAFELYTSANVRQFHDGTIDARSPNNSVPLGQAFDIRWLYDGAANISIDGVPQVLSDLDTVPALNTSSYPLRIGTDRRSGNFFRAFTLATLSVTRETP